MTIKERDEQIQAVMNSELYLPVKRARIEQIMNEFSSLTSGDVQNPRKPESFDYFDSEQREDFQEFRT